MSEKKSDSQHHFEHLANIEERLRNARKICTILDSIGVEPRSVVDVGCGYGFFLAEAGKAWKLDRMLGIDGPWVEQAQLQFDRERFWVRDLQEPVRLPDRFDLAACLEVAEHLREASSETLVDLLCSAADIVLFSAAIPGQGGKGHLNEQYPSYWATRFATRGFVPIDILHPIVWTDSALFPWFRQNLLIFVHERRLPDYPQFAAYRTPASLLDRVHPHILRRRLKQLREARTRADRLEAELSALRKGPGQGAAP
jgi:SAM-dependent methyltransferase